MFSDGSVENVKADDSEREGQSRPYIDNSWGVSKMNVILQESSDARQHLRCSPKAYDSLSMRTGRVLLEHIAYVT